MAAANRLDGGEHLPVEARAEHLKASILANGAQAQEQFNFVRTVGAVTPGLLLCYLGVYGASAAPDFGHQVWVVPFILAGSSSIALAVWLSGHPTPSCRPLAESNPPPARGMSRSRSALTVDV